MKSTSKALFGLVAVALLTATGCSNKNHEYQSVVYGTIFLGENSETTVEAVVIKDGKIAYAGTAEGARQYESKSAEVLHLKDGEFMMPGITDAHAHPAVAWDAKKNCLMLKEGWNLEKYLNEIRDYIKDRPNDVVYRVNGYVESEFKTEEQKNNPKALLDAICTTTPIVATDGGGHGVWCNSKAIDMICEKFPNIKKVDPEHPGQDNDSVPGGTVERNAQGEIIGFFRDKCATVVNAACVKFTKESYKAAIVAAQEEYASLGYTSYNESMINESSNVWETPKLAAYKELESEGKLTSYVAGSFIVGNRDDSTELVDEAIRLRDENKGGNFEVTDIKIFMDGVVEGGSAFLKDPYEHTLSGQEGGDYRGSSAWENDVVKLGHLVAKANAAGMPAHFHAVGDQASLDAVEAIELAAEEIGIEKVKAARNVMTHLQIVDDSIYQKFHDYNVIATLNPWANKAPGFYEETEVYLLGEKRASAEYPYKKFLDNQVNVSFGTDYGSSFTYHLNEAFLTLTRRKRATVDAPEIDDKTLLNEAERLTPLQALNALGSGGAYQLKKEAEFGTIAVGKTANLVVVNKNLLTVPESEIMSVSPTRTMFQGKWVYTKN